MLQFIGFCSYCRNICKLSLLLASSLICSDATCWEPILIHLVLVTTTCVIPRHALSAYSQGIVTSSPIRPFSLVALRGQSIYVRVHNHPNTHSTHTLHTHTLPYRTQQAFSPPSSDLLGWFGVHLK